MKRVIRLFEDGMEAVVGVSDGKPVLLLGPFDGRPGENISRKCLDRKNAVVIEFKDWLNMAAFGKNIMELGTKQLDKALEESSI